MERKRVAEAAKGVGRPKVGGPFELVDQRGERWGDERMRGRYSLVSDAFNIRGWGSEKGRVWGGGPNSD